MDPAFALLAVGLLSLQNPETRCFRMGFTPWPSELSIQGIETADKFLKAHGDLVSIMLIGGIPWQEALDDKPFSEDVNRQLSFKPHKGAKVFLSISPLAMDRKSLAPYWGEKDNLPLPADWKDQPFDSPKVISALTKFTLRSVAALKPHYLAIGVEINALLSLNRAAWPAYKRMHRSIYQSVKQAHPTLPVFFTTEVNHFLGRSTEAKGSGQEAEVADLMRHSDLFAMSYYPHMTWDTAYPIKSGFFSFASRFQKQVAMSETGMLSKPVTVMGLELKGGEELQRQYYEVLLSSAQKGRWAFVTTFCTTDYEKLLPAIPPETRDVANIWTYTGLQSSDRSLKPAGRVWDSWFAKKLQE